MNFDASSRDSSSLWADICATRRVFGLGALVSLSFIYCHGQVFLAMVRQWWSNDMYSYAFVIPPETFVQTLLPVLETYLPRA